MTAPSSGVALRDAERLNFAVRTLRDLEYDVVVGECVVDQPANNRSSQRRAAELMAMLTDPSIKAVIPPWGGTSAIEVLAMLDFEEVAAADATWFIGYSDVSTLLTPLTLLTGTATLHGNNLMDTPYRVPTSLMSWLDIVTLPTGSEFAQRPAGVYRVNDWDDWTTQPQVTEHIWNGGGGWRRLDGGRSRIEVTGTLIGGCIETLSALVGTRYFEVADFVDGYAPTGLIVYVESGLGEPARIRRDLELLRAGGLFASANAILVGRTPATDPAQSEQIRATLEVIGDLGVPIIGDVECGHVPPHLPIVNGALGRLCVDLVDPSSSSLVQILA
ncbi:S66 family peptidase [Nocardia gipuzkoensis]